MSAVDNQPYTYLIGWSKLNKWYYGVRYSKKCHPSDLWVNYFTSSKYVDEFRKKNGEPDIIQIRKIFTNGEQAIKWEEKVLKKLKVLNENKWINKNISGAFGLETASKAGKISNKKRLENGTHHWLNENENILKSKRQKIKIENGTHNFQNPKVKHKQKKALSQRLKNNNPVYTQIADGKNKFISDNPVNILLQCPHCNKIGPKPQMIRWHFKKCKWIKNKCQV